MRIHTLLIGLLFCVAMPVWADVAAPATGTPPPDQVVETTAKAILAAVAAKRDTLKQDPMLRIEDLGLAWGKSKKNRHRTCIHPPACLPPE